MEKKTRKTGVERMPPLYCLFWSLLRWLYRWVYRWQVFNAERVPLAGPVILAANHASFMDPTVVGSALRRPISYLARDTLFRFPVFGTVLRHIKTIPVDREGASPRGLKTLFDRLAQGEAVVLFPEGTRTKDGRLGRARSGIGYVVIRSGAPVIPVRVFGSFEVWNRYRRFPGLHRIQIKYGKPLRFVTQRERAGRLRGQDAKPLYQEVADEIMDAIARLQPFEEKEHFG